MSELLDLERRVNDGPARGLIVGAAVALMMWLMLIVVVV